MQTMRGAPFGDHYGVLGLDPTTDAAIPRVREGRGSFSPSTSFSAEPFSPTVGSSPSTKIRAPGWVPPCSPIDFPSSLPSPSYRQSPLQTVPESSGGNPAMSPNSSNYRRPSTSFNFPSQSHAMFSGPSSPVGPSSGLGLSPGLAPALPMVSSTALPQPSGIAPPMFVLTPSPQKSPRDPQEIWVEEWLSSLGGMEGVDPRISPRSFNYTPDIQKTIDIPSPSRSCPDLFSRSNPTSQYATPDAPRRNGGYHDYLQQQQQQQQQQYLQQQQQQQLLLQQHQWQQQRQQIAQQKKQQQRAPEPKSSKQLSLSQQQQQQQLRGKLTKSDSNLGGKHKPKLSLPLSQSQPSYAQQQAQLHQQQHRRSTTGISPPSSPTHSPIGSPLQSPHVAASSSAPDLRSSGPIAMTPSYSLPHFGGSFPMVNVQTGTKIKSNGAPSKPYSQLPNAAYNRKGQEHWNAQNGFRPRSYSPSSRRYLVQTEEHRKNASGENSVSASPSDDGGVWLREGAEILGSDYSVLPNFINDTSSSRSRARSDENVAKTAARLLYSKDKEGEIYGSKQRRSSHSPRGYTWLNKYDFLNPDAADELGGDQNDFEQDDPEDHNVEEECPVKQIPVKDIQHKVRVRQIPQSGSAPSLSQGIKVKTPGRAAKKGEAEAKGDGAAPTHAPASNSGQKQERDHSQFDLNLDAILRGDEIRASLMIKNIPNKYNQEMLLEAINKNFKGTYDFFYLPIDFKNKCNVGYAFINFISVVSVVPFFQEFNEKKWEKFNSSKICRIAYARIQGKHNFIEHFRNSSLMHEDPKCRPLIFKSAGEGIGEQETFPAPNLTPHKPPGAKQPGHGNGTGESGAQ